MYYSSSLYKASKSSNLNVSFVHVFPARLCYDPNMLLPNDEVVKLLSCSGDPLRARVHALREAGWTLASIAAAWNPPKSRSSIKSLATQKTSSYLPVVSSPDDSTLPAAEDSHQALPTTRTHSRARRFYNKTKPTLTQAHRKQLFKLAPIARRYRSKANPAGIYAVANNELTVLCVSHYRSGTSIEELASAAGVTYRAMARRVGVGK